MTEVPKQKNGPRQRVGMMEWLNKKNIRNTLAAISTVVSGLIGTACDCGVSIVPHPNSKEPEISDGGGDKTSKSIRGVDVNCKLVIHPERPKCRIEYPLKDCRVVDPKFVEVDGHTEVNFDGVKGCIAEMKTRTAKLSCSHSDANTCIEDGPCAANYKNSDRSYPPKKFDCQMEGEFEPEDRWAHSQVECEFKGKK